MILLSTSAMAQFEEPNIVKVETEDRAKFQALFGTTNWTGQGFNSTSIDQVPVIEVRAKLQAAYGEPTLKIEDIVKSGTYRDGKAIQFEYWFIVDGKYPMMVLDFNGPFDRGMVYVGASRYVDLMPQIKRTFTKTLEESEPKEYLDYYFSPERNQWFKVSYSNGKYTNEQIKQPDHIKF